MKLSFEKILIIVSAVLAVLFIGVSIYIAASAPEPELELPPREGIVMIAGIEYCIELTTLAIEWTPLSREDMRQISLMTNLTRLELKMCSISDVTHLARLTNLERLDLRRNNITDVSPLTELTNLTHLNLSHNNIEVITSLSRLTNLVMLELGANEISDISALFHIPMKNLYIYDNARDPNNSNIPFLDEHTRGDEFKARMPNTTIHF
jgi:hypothetical protein